MDFLSSFETVENQYFSLFDLATGYEKKLKAWVVKSMDRHGIDEKALDAIKVNEKDQQQESWSLKYLLIMVYLV